MECDRYMNDALIIVLLDCKALHIPYAFYDARTMSIRFSTIDSGTDKVP
jgi:hypothetical protein